MLGIGMVDGTAGDADRLMPGESLIMYTDGLTDAMDPSDVLFGEKRLTTILQAHHGADPTTLTRVEVEHAIRFAETKGAQHHGLGLVRAAGHVAQV